MNTTVNYARIKLSNGWMELSMPERITPADLKKIELLLRLVTLDAELDQRGEGESDAS